MGIHISLYEVANREMREDAEWDWVRHAGDREFAATEEFERGYMQIDDTSLWRPADIEAAEAWVKKSIEPAGNRMRLLEVLLRMKTNPNLWFENGW